MSSVRAILVTGSNQGLGMHTVHQLAKTPDVLIFMGSRKLAAAEEAKAKFAKDINASSSVVPVQLDITDSASIKDAVAFIASYLKEKSLPGLDVLVNNAGAAGATFEAIYAVNVFGTAAITEAIRPLLKNGGSIINVSSILGSCTMFTKSLSDLRYLAYSSSKAAVNSLTVQWAAQEEQKSSGIRVVSICPGYNATNLNHYAGTMDPADGCKIIVDTALAKEGRSAVYFNKDGDLPW
ncbi:hypothetical protein C8R43DRAFT_1133629 [Mycena crocata]|nr:hypothetical protein C8R43DRAFT_1133629 [Mycena crocata]